MQTGWIIRLEIPITAGLVTIAEVKEFIKQLLIQDNLIVIGDPEKAEWINALYTRLIKEVFNLPLHVYANRILTELIKSGLQRNELNVDDLSKR